jgi:deoxyribodipyrimidine photo-lyase
MVVYNSSRVRTANPKSVNEAGTYVLYWCQMARRLRANHALNYAAGWAARLNKPLVVYEGLKLNYPWASARFHQFMLEGMRDNVAAAKKLGVSYWPFVETPDDPRRGLVRKLCKEACLLVTDDYPQFIIPAQIRAVAAAVDVPVYAIDGNSLVPLSLLGPVVGAASHLRPRLHKAIPLAWENRAADKPELPKLTRVAVDAPFPAWEPPADLSAFVKSLPVDQTVPAVADTPGGSVAGHWRLAEFVKKQLARYADGRNQPEGPDTGPSSRLSPYLHYGHLGIQEVAEAVLGPDWTPKELNLKTRNKDDYFNRDANTNGFLDEAITWRDVGHHWHYVKNLECEGRGGTKSWQDAGEAMPAFNFQSFDFSPLREGTLYTVLPEWAKVTLAKHAGDRRPVVYTLEELELGHTDDMVWNAAQWELVATGRMHNYLRMLWGKKILQWSPTAEQAYRVCEHLNNKYQLDGRDPNSYTGIHWVFGLFDRPWPPEREIFGQLRYMTSESTSKKFKLGGYYEYVAGLPTPEQVRAGQPATTTPSRLF